VDSWDSRELALITPTSAALVSWEAQGRHAGERLAWANAVVISSRNPIAAASFAIGLARVQGTTRHVAIADLVGKLPQFQSLVGGDNPYGISDSFVRGVSLNDVARPIEGSSNVFIMPSGTEAVAIDSVYDNGRWRTVAAGFRELGALLLLVAAPDTPGFAALCGHIGTVFPIDGIVPAVAKDVRVINAMRLTPPATGDTVVRAIAPAEDDIAARRRRLFLIVSALLVVALAVAVGAFWPTILSRLTAAFGKR